MKRTAAALAALSAIVLTSGLIPAAKAEEKKPYKIYLSNNFVGNDWRQQMLRIAETTVKKPPLAGRVANGLVFEKPGAGRYFVPAEDLEEIDRRVALLATQLRGAGWLADADLPRGGVRIELLTVDGRTLNVRVDHGRGTPGNPVTRDELVAKFRRAATTRLPGATADRVLDLLLNLETVANVREITALLRA